jgi:S-adenosylmethionine hydrolase
MKLALSRQETPQEDAEEEAQEAAQEDPVGAPPEVEPPMKAPPRPIVFLSDYGLEDEFVGICHGVIARLAPGAEVIDLIHTIPAHDVFRGALLLSESLRFMPNDAVYLAVVDPGVGTDRPGVAVQAASGAVFVGPDNGLLSLAFEQAGGATAAALITSRKVVLEPVSATFHGRDVFAPAASHVASGMPMDELGETLDPANLMRLTITEPSVHRGVIACEVLSVDRFGNVQLGVRRSHLAEAHLQRVDELQVRTSAGSIRVRRAFTFAEVPEGDYAALLDSRGWLALVRNGARAADGLGLRPGDGIVIEDPGA